MQQTKIQIQIPGFGCSLCLGSLRSELGKWRWRTFPCFVLAKQPDAANTSALTTTRNKTHTHSTPDTGVSALSIGIGICNVVGFWLLASGFGFTVAGFACDRHVDRRTQNPVATAVYSIITGTCRICTSYACCAHQHQL
jgi:hypothetical protein